MSTITTIKDPAERYTWRYGWRQAGEVRSAAYAIPYIVGRHEHGHDVSIKHGAGKTVLNLSTREARRLAMYLLACADDIEEAELALRRQRYRNRAEANA